MNLEEVCNKSKIDFPKDLDLKQSEDLLKYLAKNLGLKINYTIFYHKSIAYEEEGVKTLDGSFKIIGQISGKLGKFDSFTMDSDFVSEIYKVRRFEFEKVPGGDIDEYRKQVRELWNDIREAVGGYFESCS